MKKNWDTKIWSCSSNRNFTNINFPQAYPRGTWRKDSFTMAAKASACNVTVVI